MSSGIDRPFLTKPSRSVMLSVAILVLTALTADEIGEWVVLLTISVYFALFALFWYKDANSKEKEEDINLKTAREETFGKAGWKGIFTAILFGLGMIIGAIIFRMTT